MPTDSIIVSLVVVALMTVFAAALMWADRQTAGLKSKQDNFH